MRDATPHRSRTDEGALLTRRLAWIGSVLLALGSPLIGGAVAAGDEASPFAIWTLNMSEMCGR